MTKAVSPSGSTGPARLPRTIVAADGCRPLDRYGFGVSMYQTPFETVDLLTMAIAEATGHELRWARSVESGVVEEYAVVAENSEGQRLICRIWPVFFAYERRIEYKLYHTSPVVSGLVETYLGLCARTNGARLINKDSTSVTGDE